MSNVNRARGWPLTIVITPEKEPFYAATYLPKEAQMGRLSCDVQILRGLQGMWTNEQARVRKAIEQIAHGYAIYLLSARIISK